MKSVLLIEDDRDFRDLIVQFLKTSEFSLILADGIESASEIIQSEKPFDAAIVDFWLGDDNSVPLFDMIRERLPGVPIILMSGGGGNLNLESTQAVGEISGAIHFLHKPFRKSELLSVLEKLA